MTSSVTDWPRAPEACPEWCLLSTGHAWESRDDAGVFGRTHLGPLVGGVTFEGQEHSDNPGVIALEAYLGPELGRAVLTGDQLRVLVRDLTRAVTWLDTYAPAR